MRRIRFAVSDIPLSGSYCNDHMGISVPEDNGEVYITRHSFMGVMVLGQQAKGRCGVLRKNMRPCGRVGYVRMVGDEYDHCRFHTDAAYQRDRPKLA